MTVTIWHNPRCSKSRATLKLLQDQGCNLKVRLYLKDRPTIEELTSLQKKLNIPAIEFTRHNETEFRELKLTKDSSDITLIAAMSVYPGLIERPLVIAGGKARIGRPPESVLEIL